jgi:protoporphyrinogen oxidase
VTATLHVLGGGPAGLAAAERAAMHGHAVRLHEAAAEAGGNCRTLRIGDCGFDTGAHRLHVRDPADARAFRDLLGDTLLEVKAPSRILREGRSFLFPPTPLDLARNLPPRLLARAAWDLAFRPRPHGAPDNFLDYARGRYGETLANLFLLGYTRKLWGRDPAELSPAVAGKRLKGFGARALLAENLLHRPARHLDGSFLYPREGIGALTRALVSRIPQEGLITGSRVARIRHDGARILSVSAATLEGTREEGVERVVSTLPLPAFLRALDPAPPVEILAAAEGIAFRNLVLCVLRLSMDRFTENASLYFPDPDVPFTRLYEPKNRSPFMAPSGETCVVLEIPCDPGDATWRATDTEIVASSIESLARAAGLARGVVRESSVHRVGHAYPVLERGAEARVADMLAYCGRFANLRLAGRNALFRYAHLHDMLRQGRAAADALLDTYA